MKFHTKYFKNICWPNSGW